MKFVFPLGMIVLIFSSCQKIMEYYSLNSTASAPPVCRVKSYSSTYFETVNRTEIHYNNEGNPAMITYFAEWLPEGKATEKFVYDSLGRLILHEPFIEMGNKRVYVYEGGSRFPLRDTATDFLGKKYVETFKTDAKGRIIEEEIRWIYTPPEIEDDFIFETEVHRFYYDVHGNRQANPFDYPWHKTIRYSDKPSLYSLHPVWQLIHRDYSRNGIFNVNHANENGLPVTFKADEFAYWQPFFDMNQNSEIVYDCMTETKK
jgi:hypothetical protein